MFSLNASTHLPSERPMKTKAEWQTLSENITLRNQAYIGGRFQSAVSGETFKTINPATERVLAEVASCDQADVDLAVAAAKAAFVSGSWSGKAPGERKKVLLRLADLMQQHRDELALIDTLDMGKSISEMLSVDLPDSIDCFRWTAESIVSVRPSHLVRCSQLPVVGQ
ncbi:MAG: acyl-CoA reductase-like NAD-dependent aldehyde dehydrogenase [Pseudomonadales bacterium]|jgi:acyl-CoA reductase-like NAD-dependent aldehyde dehydrogenase